jgi:hypothetical protein
MILELIERLTEEATKRNMDFLLIGGQAMSHLGYQRLTMDVDFLGPQETRESWEQTLLGFGYSLSNRTEAFDQFHHSTPGWPRVDIMYVNQTTWRNLSEEAGSRVHGQVNIKVPSARHMVALKLHAARSPSRSDPGKDWTDIHQLVKRHGLDTTDREFATIVVRYGGEEALERLKNPGS